MEVKQVQDFARNPDRQGSSVAPARVVIKFGFSSSSRYEKALELCLSTGAFHSSGTGRAIEHTLDIPVTQLETAIQIYDIVGSWKSCSMTIDGKLSTKKHLTQGCLGCYRVRRQAHSRELHCSGDRAYSENLWGCTSLNMPLVNGDWIGLGRFDDMGGWVFDKVAILGLIRSRSSRLQHCPAFDLDRIESIVESLPVISSETENWHHFKTVNDAGQLVTTGVFFSRDSSGEEFVLDGLSEVLAASPPILFSELEAGDKLRIMDKVKRRAAQQAAKENARRPTLASDSGKLIVIMGIMLLAFYVFVIL